MKIFTGDYKVIKADIEELFDRIYHSNNKIERIGLFGTLLLLIEEYIKYDSEGYRYVKSLNSNRKFVHNQIILMNQLDSKCLEDFFQNKDIHRKLCNQILND